MQVNFPKADLDSDVTFDTEASKLVLKKLNILHRSIGGGQQPAWGGTEIFIILI